MTQPGLPDREEWCRRIRAAREAAGLTQDEAARRLGVVRQSYAQYEADRVPTVSRMYEFIQALGFDPGIVFPELGPRKKPRF